MNTHMDLSLASSNPLLMSLPVGQLIGLAACNLQRQFKAMFLAVSGIYKVPVSPGTNRHLSGDH